MSFDGIPWFEQQSYRKTDLILKTWHVLFYAMDHFASCLLELEKL